MELTLAKVAVRQWPFWANEQEGDGLEFTLKEEDSSSLYRCSS